MSKKFMNVLKTMLAVMLIASCSAADEELKNTAAQTAENQAIYYENASLSLAKLVAETYLMEYETINEWENAVLAEPYPLYNPATEVITYLEYPVIKDGKRKGYIMVTLKEDEPRVVEASENSEMTNYEALADKAETNDIKAVRFSFASFVAEDPTVSRSGNRKVLAALGNIEHEIEIGEVTRSGSMYEEYINNYKAKVEENDGFLDINKDVYEANKEWIEYRNGQRSRGNISKYDKPPVSEEIIGGKNSLFIVNQFNTTYPDKTSGPSGCVPTAGALVIAYYAKKNNCPSLWDGKNVPSGTHLVGDSTFKSIVLDLRNRLGMTGKGAKTYNLPSAISGYMVAKGGMKFSYTKECSGGSWDWQDLVKIKKSIKEDYPAFLSYNTVKGDNDSGHCAVIYKVSIQRDWAGNYKECTYYINTGWIGNSEKYPSYKSVHTWDNTIKYFMLAAFENLD